MLCPIESRLDFGDYKCPNAATLSLRNHHPFMHLVWVQRFDLWQWMKRQLGKRLQSQTSINGCKLLFYLLTQKSLCFPILVSCWCSCISLPFDSLIRDISLCYVDIVVLFPCLSHFLGSIYSLWSYSWSLQERRRGRLTTDSK